ncbi:MAG: hypothetical protein ABJ327_15220 [Litoreibacter sp.]
MQDLEAEVQRALDHISKIEGPEVEPFFHDYDFSAALAYFSDPDSHETLANLISSDEPSIRSFGLFVGSESGKKAQGLLTKLKHLEFSPDNRVRSFLMSQISLFGHVDDWSCQFVDWQLSLPDEQSRANAILFLLGASEATLRRVLNVTVSKEFHIAREILEFTPTKFEISNSLSRTRIDETMHHLFEKVRFRSFKIILLLKLGCVIDEVEASTLDEGSHVFDFLRSKNPRILKISSDFLDEPLIGPVPL